MPCVKVSQEIAASPQELYLVLSDMEKYPEFMPNLVRVTILEKRKPITISQWVSNVDGRMICWTERDLFREEIWRIEYEQIAGDLKRFQGAWQLCEQENGTLVELTVDFEFGIPMLAGLLHPLLKYKVKENSQLMLAAVKKRLEGCN
ncbi:MAG: aromatase/cyclase [Sporomusaceae bacterium]|nr:aromatase/cyclase [Sporomusaceae bacterium]